MPTDDVRKLRRFLLGVGMGLGLSLAIVPQAIGQEVPITIPTCEEMGAACLLDTIRDWQAANDLCAALEAPDENGFVTEQQRQWAQGCRDRAAVDWAEAQRQCNGFLLLCLDVREWFVPFRQVLPIEIMFAFEAWTPEPQDGPNSPGPGVGGPFGGPIVGQPKTEIVPPFTGNDRDDHGTVQPDVNPRKQPR